MYEGEQESALQPEWEIDPADLVIGVKVGRLSVAATVMMSRWRRRPAERASV